MYVDNVGESTDRMCLVLTRQVRGEGQKSKESKKKNSAAWLAASTVRLGGSETKVRAFEPNEGAGPVRSVKFEFPPVDSSARRCIRAQRRRQLSNGEAELELPSKQY
eukprot:TRINITY_DN8871_c0_g1_i1.p1 TRINITY_DN8871_c0_g1~~TRINITY_DN8871_c0_g1_i1.p1  ORF type:complete len:107 (+),score=4.11 TRINITY_DN8871_c0_g1_i1:422-742(+)